MKQHDVVSPPAFPLDPNLTLTNVRSTGPHGTLYIPLSPFWSSAPVQAATEHFRCLPVLGAPGNWRLLIATQTEHPGFQIKEAFLL